MTRVLTVSNIKGRGAAGMREMPDPNSRAGELYADLLSGKGVRWGGRRNHEVNRLQDFYGVVVDVVEGYWIMIGEWIGRDFVPVERLSQPSPPKPVTPA